MASITISEATTGFDSNRIFAEENDGGVFLNFSKDFGKYAQFYEKSWKGRTLEA